MKPNQLNGVRRLAAEMATEKINKERRKIMLMAISTVSTAMCITLHDKWNFDSTMLNRLLAQISDQYDSVLKKYVTMEDIEQWCKENKITNMIHLRGEENA